MTRLLPTIIIAIVIASCGGGGGSSPASPVPVVVSVNFSSSATEVSRGQSVTLTWSSQNANSCSASGDWSSNTSVSGTEDILVSSAGTNTYTLTCSGVSKTITINVSEVFDANLFIDDDQLFSGLFFYKKEGYYGCLATIQAELAIADDASLYFKSFSLSEIRALSYSSSSELSLGDDFSNGVYSYPITNAGLNATNVVAIRTSTADPYAIDETSLNDLEQLSADITLNFDSVEGNDRSCWGADIAMSVLAFPRSENGDKNDSEFVGTSQTSDSYSFLYLVDNREIEGKANDLPTESDLFNIVFNMYNSFHSYGSKPNMEEDQSIIVNSDLANYKNLGGLQITGDRDADRFNFGSGLGQTGSYGVKYLHPTDTSNQRIFVKKLADPECFREGYGDANLTCSFSEFEIVFTRPDGLKLWGFGLGGYYNQPNTTYVKYWAPR